MEVIPSFQVDHSNLQPGIYISRQDTMGDFKITTYDIRMTAPNHEPAVNCAAIHTIEHLVATFLRNNENWKQNIIYWGPMGCLTGNYLIVKAEFDGTPKTKIIRLSSDIEDGDLTDKVVVVGTVNKEVSGTYVIKYIVIDSCGNTSSVTREVIVNEKSGTINLETITEENENLTTEITIEAETENEKMYYAVTKSNEKPNDSEYKEMDLVTSLNNTKSISPSYCWSKVLDSNKQKKQKKLTAQSQSQALTMLDT